MAGWIYCKRTFQSTSNFRCEDTIQNFLKRFDIPGIAGIDTRALTKILREKGTMNGMITTDENYDLDAIIPRLKAYTTGKVVEKVTCCEKTVLKGSGKKVALLDLGAKEQYRKISESERMRGNHLSGIHQQKKILAANPDGIMLSNGPGDPKECTEVSKRSVNYMSPTHRSLQSVWDISLWHWQPVRIPIR